MATVRNTIQLQDKMTPVLRSIIKSMNSTVTAMASIDGVSDRAFNNARRDIRAAEEALNQFNNSVDTMPDRIRRSNDGFTVMKGILSNIASMALYKVGAFLKNTATSAIQTASDLVEVQNVVDVSFGESAQVINDWSKTTLEAFGMSELSAKRYAGTMGAMLKSSGLAGDAVNAMSMDMAQLSADMASFYNLDLDTAFQKIRAGISGETEPLKQLGINMSVANMEAFALANGIETAWSEMSQAEQTMLRYQYLMQATADAQGDFNRTSDAFANQSRLLQENWSMFTASIATHALPALASLFKWLNDLIKRAPALIEAVGGWIDKFKEAVPYILAVATAFTLYQIPAITAMITKYAILGYTAVATAIKTAAAWAMANMPLMVAIALVLAAVYAWNNLGEAGKILAIIIGVIVGAILMWIAVQNILNLALTANPIGVIIMAIAALIAIIIAVILWIMKLWESNMDFKYGVIKIWNSILGFFDQVPIFFQGVGNGIADAFGWAKIKVLEILQSMANGAIDIINGLISTLNKIPGVSIDSIEHLTFAASGAAEEEAAKQARAESLSASKDAAAAKAAERDAQMAINRAADEAAIAAKKAEAEAQKNAHAEEEYASDMSKYMGLDGIDLSEMGIAGGNLDSIGKIKDDVSITDDDIKLLKDVAATEFVNKYTTLRPEMQVTFGDVRETADVNKILTVIEDMVEEAYSSSLVGEGA